MIPHDPEMIVCNPQYPIQPDAQNAAASGCEIDLQTDKTGKTCMTGRTGSNSSLAAPPLISSGPSVLDANDPDLIKQVEAVVAIRPRNNHDSLFNLARLCRDFELKHNLPKYGLPMEDRNLLFRIWYEKTPPEYRRESMEDYRDDFTRKFHDARDPLGSAPYRRAWELSRTKGPPEYATKLYGEMTPCRARLLSFVAIQAEINQGYVIVPLDAVAALAMEEGITELGHPQKVQRRLGGLRDVLEKVRPGCRQSRLATVYRYRAPAV